MIELLILILISVIVIRATYKTDDLSTEISDKISDKLSNLWSVAHQGMRDNKLLKAEKALLTILKIDEKNAAAYNRLGILYAKQKEYKDAIDCFEIASSIEKSASSLHNLGLIYYETGNYSKASIAFEEAIELDDKMASRHIAHAKVQEKLGNDRKMLHELEKAVELEPTKETYGLLLRAYEIKQMAKEAEELKKEIKKINPNTNQRKIIRPPRVVV